MAGIWDWLTQAQQQQNPQFAPSQPPPSPPFVPQTMVQPPVFAQAPQMAQDVAAGVADPLLKAGNYLGGIMQGSQQFSWPETIQHGAALAMAMAPGPKGERIAGGLERGLAGAAEAAAPAGIRAYHGSPYDFPAFDINKIGTGEGAQAYGHGLYFAEQEATARAYKKNLAPAAADVAPSYRGGGEWQVTTREGDTHNREFFPTKAEADAFAANYDKGHMYEVNIKAQPEQFLDYNKVLSPEMREKFAQLIPERAAYFRNPMSSPSGQSAYEELAGGMPGGLYRNQPEASKILQEAGVPGLRYLDQGSRGSGQGTHNYVVFNDKLIDILRKYGLIGALGGSMSAPYFVPQGQQQ